MTPYSASRGPLTLALVTAVLWVLPGVCSAQQSSNEPATASNAATATSADLTTEAPATPDPRQIQALTDTRIDQYQLRLGRAVLEYRMGNPRGVVENLEYLDYTTWGTFENLDLAAFQLGNAYLQLQSYEDFISLAESVTRWNHRSLYTQWIAYQYLLVRTDKGIDLTGAENQAALRLIESAESNQDRDALTIYLRALAFAASGADDEGELKRLSKIGTKTELSRTLAGVALIQLAGRALARGEDAGDLLRSVAPGSRYHSTAQHMLGLSAYERGDRESGRKILEQLLAQDSTYSNRRQVSLVLAGEALDQEGWESAYYLYGEIDSDWQRQQTFLENLVTGGEFEELWRVWDGNSSASDVLALDATLSRNEADRLAHSSTDLGNSHDVEIPGVQVPVTLESWSWSVAPPSHEARTEVKDSERALYSVTSQLERTSWDLEKERQFLEGQRRYFTYGKKRVVDERAYLWEHGSKLDSLKRNLDAVLAQLRNVRDESTHRIAMRTAQIIERSADHILWMHAMRHFYLGGPYEDLPVDIPLSVPSPEELMIEEEALARMFDEFARQMSATAPDLIARSHDQAWGPNIIDRALRQHERLRGFLAWLARIETSVDSSIVAYGSSDQLRDLERRFASLETSVDSLRHSHLALRNRVAAEAVQVALSDLKLEREAIDYGLAASSYGLTLQLTRANATDTDADDDSPQAAGWRSQSVAQMETFLDRHPESFARGEIRFRLADLMLIGARQSFRGEMAVFVRAQEQGRSTGALPLLDHEPALKVYRRILSEDADFRNLDAVYFNAGMILADNADPEAEDYFKDLVTNYPDSPFCQESYLRMGDMHFNEKRFASCIQLYQRSAAGADTTLRIMALYKLGWARFNVDEFVPAADAFRSVLDLYLAGRGALHEVDVEDESESYLIHSLARAGGARAFEEYFDGVGHRPYEMRLLMAMGQHFRRFSLYSEAAAADKLHIQRDPQSPEALTSAQRLTNTYKRWDRNDEAIEAQLRFAANFAPGSGWYQAQESDSIRDAGETFAKESWTTVALHHHHRAQAKDSPEDWRQALVLYETVISYWPDDDETAQYQLNAGQASFHLKEYPAAIQHFTAASEAGTDSIPELALRQMVAVSDAWYETSRTQNSGFSSSQGSDSLAQAVLRTGDNLLDSYPNHEGGEDILWRQGNLAFAHGWFDRAAGDFDRMATRYPDDKRAPLGASLRADALFRLEKYEEAGAAFELAYGTAQRSGEDSLAARAAEALPVCYYRHAEATVAADSTDYARHAALFQRIATEWPEYEHAHLAQYRASLAHLNAGDNEAGVHALRLLIANFSTSEYVKDAHLHIAKTWEAAGEQEKAAQAYFEFSERYAEDESSDDALLKAAELYAFAGLTDKTDELRLSYLEKYPEDSETGMEILEDFARRDLERVGPEVSIASLLTVAKGAKGARANPSRLSQYLSQAKDHPELASRELVAQVHYLEGEEARAGYDRVVITLPLRKSIKVKQQHLDNVIVLYRKSVDLGVSEWAHASAFRIGESLVAFGLALEQSERPKDLGGDDLLAYEDVLFGESQVFYDRGVDVWSDLLILSRAQDSQDSWTAQAQESMWTQLANRFLYRAEVSFPLVAGVEPAEKPVLIEKVGATNLTPDSFGEEETDFTPVDGEE